MDWNLPGNAPGRLPLKGQQYSKVSTSWFLCKVSVSQRSVFPIDIIEEVQLPLLPLYGKIPQKDRNLRKTPYRMLLLPLDPRIQRIRLKPELLIPDQESRQFPPLLHPHTPMTQRTERLIEHPTPIGIM